MLEIRSEDDLYTKLPLGARGGVQAPIGSAEVGTSSAESLVREAGRAEACRESTEEAPHPDCRSPIQVFLWPLPWAMPEQGPLGYVKVNLVSADASATWEVLADGRVVCRTPCSRWMPPSVALMMKEINEPFYRQPDSIKVPDLRPYAAQGPLDVRADTTSFGGRSGGIVMTTLGGLGTAVGIALTAVGYGIGEPAIGGAGLATLAAGTAVLVPGIVIIVKSGAGAEVVPSAPVHLGSAPPEGDAIVIGPGVLQGQF